MFPFIIAGILFFITVYLLGWANGFSAGEQHVVEGIEVIIPEIIPPPKLSRLPVRYY